MSSIPGGFDYIRDIEGFFKIVGILAMALVSLACLFAICGGALFLKYICG
jgi:hypothetical protein